MAPNETEYCCQERHSGKCNRTWLPTSLPAALLAALAVLPSACAFASPEAPPGPQSLKVRYTSQRAVAVRYRCAGQRPVGVQLWISTDRRQWIGWLWSDRAGQPLVFSPPRQGRYYLALTAADRPSSDRREDLTPAIVVIFDWEPPLLRLLGVKAVYPARGQPVLQIRWAAWDEHLLPDRPVSLFYRPRSDQDWQKAADLPNTGAFDWPLPGRLQRANFEIRLTATDRAGNTSQASCAVRLAELFAPDGPQAPASRPAATSQPAEHVKSATSAERSRPQPAPGAASEAQRLYRLATWHLLRGQVLSAESLLRRALELDPALTDARAALANLLCRKGRYAEAVTQYETLLNLKPDDVRAWRNLALVYMAMKNYPKARTTLQRLIALKPDDPSGWLDLGDVEALMGRTAQARSYWLRAEELAGKNSRIKIRARKRLATYLRSR